MKTMLRMLPLALLFCGIVLFTFAIFAKSGISPVGAMDCGCGGGTECVTKNSALNSGLLLSLGGAGLMILGAVGSGVQLYRRLKLASAFQG